MNENKFKSYDFSERFTRFPGGRDIGDGNHTGEHFYNKFLKKALDQDEYWTIDMRGVLACSTSFLDGAFGRFANRHGAAEFWKRFRVDTDDEELMTEIKFCVVDADNERKEK